MKKLFALFFLVPCFAKAQFTITNTSTVSLMEPRTGNYPLDLQRVIKESDTCYELAYRDQQESQSVNMETLKFGNIAQLKYFSQGLVALSKGQTGDIAKYKEYTIKRMDVKKQGQKGMVWYVLTNNDGTMTQFQQPELDRMVAAIKTL